MKTYRIFIIFILGMMISTGARAQWLLYAEPIVSDSSTVILDHFNKSTLGEIVGSISYGGSISQKGLSEVINFSSDNFLIYSISANLESAGTMEMWILPYSYSINLLTANLYHSYSDPGKGNVFKLWLDSIGEIRVSGFGGTKSNEFISNSRNNLIEWTHVAISWGDSTKIYINGRLDMVSSEKLRPDINSSPTYLYLPSWGSDHYFTMSEFHVSKVQRSDTEIASRIRYIRTDKTIYLTAGSLLNILTPFERETITKLHLIGTIDARDFKTMRDSMPALIEIDMRNVTVSAYTGTQGPAGNSVITYLSNTIPRNAFTPTNYYNGGIRSIVFPETITSIDDDAFYDCFVFGGDVIIPNSVKSIGASAFGYCALRSITIPNSVTFIGGGAFIKCENLKVVNMSDSITQISAGLFAGCWQMTSITIPNSVTHIGDGAFDDCGGLQEINIPNSVIYIGNRAFAYCWGLKGITIPSSVTYIGEEAFYTCLRLSSIYEYSPIPIDLSNSPNVFESVDKNTCILYVPAGTKTLYQLANQWKDFVNIVEMAPTGTKALANDQLIVYPTIVTDGFSIDNGERTTHVSICTLNGVRLLSIEINGKSCINMNGFPAGMYIVKITTSEGVLERKIIKR